MSQNNLEESLRRDFPQPQAEGVTPSCLFPQYLQAASAA